jgi:hypothetical protein
MTRPFSHAHLGWDEPLPAKAGSTVLVFLEPA